MEIVSVDGKGGMKDFIEFQYSLYKGDSLFVPQPRIAVKDLLNREKHPFYKTADVELFLARKNGKAVGRVAAIFDRAHNQFHGETAGFFGFFESINDQEVANALLERAKQWLKQKGATVIRGPMNPSTNYECGTLVEGFDSSPMVMMTYNPRYYPELFDKAGLRKSKDLLAYVSHAQKIELQKISRVAQRALKQNGVTVRTINMKDFAGEVSKVWNIYSAAWSKNWGLRTHVERRVRAHGQGYEDDSKARSRSYRRKKRSNRGLCHSVARRQSGAQTGRRTSFSPRDLQNPVLSTFGQKCTGPRTRSGRGVPVDGLGGGILRHAGAECTQARLWRM